MASSPPCTRGCSVFTRPSIISGNPVNSETSITAKPAALSAAAVPPVETISTPRSLRAVAKETSPVLSDTERSARRIDLIGHVHPACLQRRLSWSFRQGHPSGWMNARLCRVSREVIPGYRTLQCASSSALPSPRTSFREARSARPAAARRCRRNNRLSSIDSDASLAVKIQNCPSGSLHPADGASVERAAAIRMQVKMDGVGQILLQPQLALRRFQNIDAFELVARRRKRKMPRMHQTEALQISIVARLEHGVTRLVSDIPRQRYPALGSASRRPSPRAANDGRAATTMFPRDTACCGSQLRAQRHPNCDRLAPEIRRWQEPDIAATSFRKRARPPALRSPFQAAAVNRRRP